MSNPVMDKLCREQLNHLPAEEIKELFFFLTGYCEADHQFIEGIERWLEVFDIERHDYGTGGLPMVKA